MYDIKISDYKYELPDEAIAKHPLEERDSSKLLIYKDATLTESCFNSVPDIIDSNTTLIFNNTKVIYARILFQKSSGAKIEIFCLEPISPSHYLKNFESLRECKWDCLVGNSKKWKDGKIICNFTVDGTVYCLDAEREDSGNGENIITFRWDAPISFSEVLEHCGKIPIPPYLNRESEDSDLIRYQTVYSKREGSVAAPTAGLHFTNDILSRLEAKGIDIEEVTLHVGAGTFRPIKSETIAEHNMHTEHIYIPLETIKSLAKCKKKIVAVGTTSVRTVESLYWMGVKLIEGRDSNPFHIEQWECYDMQEDISKEDALQAIVEFMIKVGLETLVGSTTIIIVPGYKFRIIDGMFTNFHQPQSTLLLLISAIVGQKWRYIYKYALEHQFRFLSYGDSNLLWI